MGPSVEIGRQAPEAGEISPQVQFEIFATPEALDQRAAEIVAGTVRKGASENRHAKFILPTGNTPVGMYENLGKMHNDPEIGLDFSHVIVFNLDEYCSDPDRLIGRNHPGSFSRFMKDNFYSGVNVPKGQRFIPDSQALHPFPLRMISEAMVYDALFEKAGTFDLAVLGIGENGHIGFNEPGSERTTRTRVVGLTPETREVNKAPFGSLEATPEYAITLGIDNILSAESILLLAKGERKAEAIQRAFFEPITSEVPASFLQLHPNVKVLLDQEAAMYFPTNG